MVPSEELELKGYHFAEFAGRARLQPADLGALATSLQFMEQAVLDLHARSFLEFRQWSLQKAIGCSMLDGLALKSRIRVCKFPKGPEHQARGNHQ
jgi:hypothetical protein